MMELLCFSFNSARRSVKALALGLGLLTVGHSAMAVDAVFYNNKYLSTIDNVVSATNFVNDRLGTFDVPFPSPTYLPNWQVELYYGWTFTQNFTNFGKMTSTIGFRFDTHYGPMQAAAANIYNAKNGLINCGTSLNAVQLGFGAGVFGYGGIQVEATNIMNAGLIALGPGGGAKFFGNSVDLSQGKVAIQPILGARVYARGETDTSTNKWIPASSLFPNQAYSAPVRSVGTFFLSPSKPYYVQQPTSATNVTVRMVFIQTDDTNNVSEQVYFSPDPNGAVQIEWAGNYVDPATAGARPIYLDLYNDYRAGSATNILSYGNPGLGVPGNFVFVASDTSVGSALGFVPTNSAFPPFISPDVVTNNIYSYVNAQLITTALATNDAGLGMVSITNMPGRVEITARQQLNLSSASLSGMNYFKLDSPNQFNYDSQSPVPAPFSDLYLGNTNGSLTISNLIQSSLPLWSGSVQAWTTSWQYTDTNAATPVFYDFRVLLAHCGTTPGSPSYVQDLVLKSSNNVVISDVMNVFRTLNLNCTNLLITTNGFGLGAASSEGELNLGSSGMSWASSFPRLRTLTNNGAISTLSEANFGSEALPYLSFINSGRVNINGGGTTIYADIFLNAGAISAMLTNSIDPDGAVTIQSQASAMVGGTVTAGGAFSDTAGVMAFAGTSLQVGKSLTLTATNLLADGSRIMSSISGSNIFGVTIPVIPLPVINFWALGFANYLNGGAGLELPLKPTYGDLLGTVIYQVAPGITQVIITDTWAGEDRGNSVTGFSNNVAIGQLILDAQGTSQFYFTGTGSRNAMYVDNLVLAGNAAYNETNHPNSSIPGLTFNTNLVIYYAQAQNTNGISVAEKINGYNGDHLRWISDYAGTFSSTNLVYPDGTTNAVNAALAASSDFDSDHDGRGNSTDPTPVFVPSQVLFSATRTTNVPPLVRIQWSTIPQASNRVEYTTSLATPAWLTLTNFNSPQPYVNNGTWPFDNWEVTNVWVFDSTTNTPPRSYRVSVQPY